MKTISIPSQFLSKRQIISSLITLMLIITTLAITPSPINADLRATFTVNSSLDTVDNDLTDNLCKTSGNVCTLRAAIMQANASTGADTIQFDESTVVVPLFSALPALSDTTGGTTIIGRSAPIYILGTSAGATTDGITITSNNNKLQGVEILGFGGNGIVIDGDNNIIGVDGNGTNDANEPCIIRLNSKNGIWVKPGAENNRIAGNRIGSDSSATVSANEWNGIHLAGANNRVGVLGDNVSDDLEKNIISNSGQDGIYVSASGNTISGNSITGNSDNGIFISLVNLIRVGTDGNGVADAAEGNLISGNIDYGINVYSSTEITIAGNKIGTNAAGTDSWRNNLGGIYLNETSFSLIGTDGAGNGASAEGNLISGNTNAGIKLSGSDANTIAGNKIGTTLDGLVALQNNEGISLDDSHFNIIGINGDGIGDTLEGNLISGNGRSGILFSASNDNTIAGNKIGVDISGNVALPNKSYGITLAGNRNIVGTNGNGISDVLERNIISGNGSHASSGVFVNGGYNRISGNFIGLNVSGSFAIPNTYGIVIEDGYFNVIGSNGNGVGDAIEGNVISGNEGGGIRIRKLNATNASSNRITGNKIGTNAAGNMPVPNLGPGVKIENVSDNQIGADAAYQGNLIAYNFKGIVFTSTGQVTGTSIIANSMHNNTTGIDLGDNGRTYNDSGDGDTGPNGLINFPIVLGAEKEGNLVAMSLSYNSKANSLYYIHFYWTPTCSNDNLSEGLVYLGVSTITTGATGNYLGGETVNYTNNLEPGYIVATASDQDFSTSEFSACTYMEGGKAFVFLPFTVK